MTNPFTLSFGKQPLTYISRLEQTNEVVENFLSEPANCMMYMITGVRGVGNTLLFAKAKIDLSFFGIGLSVEGGQQFTSIDTAIETMLSLLKKEGKKCWFCMTR